MTTTFSIQELNIVLNVRLKTSPLDKAEVGMILRDAIRHETDLVRVRRDEFLKDCQRFETEYNLSSEEFLERFESGELGDDADFFKWFAAKHSFDSLDRRYQILLGATIRD